PDPGMKRKLLVLAGLLVISVGVTAALSYAFSGGQAHEPITDDVVAAAAPELEALPGESEEDLEARRRAAHEAMLDRDYPMHGLVTMPQIIVRAEADSGALPIGWLRLGGRVRLKSEPHRTSTCASGWYELHPRGFACA